MKSRSMQFAWPNVLAAFAAGALVTCGARVRASDHLDTPTVAMNPRSDIGDLYAWTSPDGRRLNLAMTIVGESFSENIEYAFHVESGSRFATAGDALSITCRFTQGQSVSCRAGSIDAARGNASSPEGLWSSGRRFRVFAGRRDDPFFNNVKGARAAYGQAAAALGRGASVDSAGCPRFDSTTAQAIRTEWRQTDGGPARNFLAGWSPASLVVSIDVSVVAKNGPLLAVWATTASDHGQMDRMGRPLTANSLLAPLGPDTVRDRLKEQFNGARPAEGAQFVAEIEKSLGLYDSFDGECGNQLLARNQAASSARYRELASLLADDRLWVNSEGQACTQFFAVELAHLAGRHELSRDCGGRTPTYSAANALRSLWAGGTMAGLDDGLDRDEIEHSTSVFPFFAAPRRAPGYAK